MLNIIEKNCSICSKKISLKENPMGLVFRDEFFICENCSKGHSRKKINEWSKTIMQNPVDGMPIALWLVHEQNKNKTMMTTKK